jgi:hypothetical protein
MSHGGVILVDGTSGDGLVIASVRGLPNRETEAFDSVLGA